MDSQGDTTRTSTDRARTSQGRQTWIDPVVEIVSAEETEVAPAAAADGGTYS